MGIPWLQPWGGINALVFVAVLFYEALAQIIRAIITLVREKKD